MLFPTAGNGIDGGNGSHVHNVLDGAFKVYEMNRFVQAHLDRADDFDIGTQGLEHLVGAIGRVEARENQCVDSLAVQS